MEIKIIKKSHKKKQIDLDEERIQIHKNSLFNLLESKRKSRKSDIFSKLQIKMSNKKFLSPDESSFKDINNPKNKKNSYSNNSLMNPKFTFLRKIEKHEIDMNRIQKNIENEKNKEKDFDSIEKSSKKKLTKVKERIIVKIKKIALVVLALALGAVEAAIVVEAVKKVITKKNMKKKQVNINIVCIAV